MACVAFDLVTSFWKQHVHGKHRTVHVAIMLVGVASKPLHTLAHRLIARRTSGDALASSLLKSRNLITASPAAYLTSSEVSGRFLQVSALQKFMRNLYFSFSSGAIWRYWATADSRLLKNRLFHVFLPPAMADWKNFIGKGPRAPGFSVKNSSPCDRQLH